jgi:ribosome-binding factor A
MHFKRSDRVGGVIQKELSDLLATKIKDPRLDLVTITRVNINDDLRAARVFFTVVGGQERGPGALAGFKSAMGYLKRKLGHRVNLRHMPELTFVYDESFDRAEAIDRIFKAIRNEIKSTTADSAER